MNPKIRKLVIAALAVLTLSGVVLTTSIHPASHEGASADPKAQESCTDPETQEISIDSDSQESVSDQTNATGEEGTDVSASSQSDGADHEADGQGDQSREDIDATERGGDDSSKQGASSGKNSTSGSGSGKSSSSGSTSQSETKTITCTLTIDCSLLIDESVLRGTGNENKQTYVPSNGKIASGKSVKIKEGSSVYDVLKSFCKAQNIQMEASYTPGLDTYYVEGINHLYEFDGGEGSGWVYFVNGQSPDYGASDVEVKEGDRIVWMYTLDYGNDVSP